PAAPGFGARASAAARAARTNGPLLLVRAIGWLVALWFLAAAVVGGLFWATGALHVHLPLLPIAAGVAALGALGYALLRTRRPPGPRHQRTGRRRRTRRRAGLRALHPRGPPHRAARADAVRAHRQRVAALLGRRRADADPGPRLRRGGVGGGPVPAGRRAGTGGRVLQRPRHPPLPGAGGGRRGDGPGARPPPERRRRRVLHARDPRRWRPRRLPPRPPH